MSWSQVGLAEVGRVTSCMMPSSFLLEERSYGWLAGQGMGWLAGSLEVLGNLFSYLWCLCFQLSE